MKKLCVIFGIITVISIIVTAGILLYHKLHKPEVYYSTEFQRSGLVNPEIPETMPEGVIELHYKDYDGNEVVTYTADEIFKVAQMLTPVDTEGMSDELSEFVQSEDLGKVLGHVIILYRDAFGVYPDVMDYEFIGGRTNPETSIYRIYYDDTYVDIELQIDPFYYFVRDTEGTILVQGSSFNYN